MELRESILQGTIRVFNQKGLKFTMDDIANALGISKKTIYTVFRIRRSCFWTWWIICLTISRSAKGRC